MDSAGTRIGKIETLIEECPFGIHDISRPEFDAVNSLPRFNMLLEVGLFLDPMRSGNAARMSDREGDNETSA